MKITTNKNGVIQLEEVFNGIILKTKDGEEMSICMRDSGFEFNYQGEWYIAKQGFVLPFKEDKINVSTQDDYYQRYDKLVRQKVEMLVAPGPAHMARMSEDSRHD